MKMIKKILCENGVVPSVLKFLINLLLDNYKILTR
jgi:hypothetical protein